MSVAENSSLYKTVIITSIRQETDRGMVKTFALAYEDGNAIPYVAGQFITFAFWHHGKEERRSYSISSSPVLDEPFAFTVKRVDNGAYSRLLIDRAQVGDKLYTTGAAGLFVLPEDVDRYEQIFFYAAGIGITPVISLIKTLLHTQPGIHATLVYSNRNKTGTVFYNELIALREKYPDTLTIEFLNSSSFDLSRARLSKWLLPTLLDEYIKTDKSKTLHYLCGPFDYMRMVVFGLEEQQIDSSQIKRENFNTNDAPVRKQESPDKGTHTVTILQQGTEHRVTVEYPDTILQAAKKNGLQLPYSCEAGRCGSCAAICTRGTVWLSYNEVLMDADLAKGRILTCVGHPINGDVTIEL